MREAGELLRQGEMVTKNLQTTPERRRVALAGFFTRSTYSSGSDIVDVFVGWNSPRTEVRAKALRHSQVSESAARHRYRR